MYTVPPLPGREGIHSSLSRKPHYHRQAGGAQRTWHKGSLSREKKKMYTAKLGVCHRQKKPVGAPDRALQYALLKKGGMTAVLPTSAPCT